MCWAQVALEGLERNWTSLLHSSIVQSVTRTNNGHTHLQKDCFHPPSGCFTQSSLQQAMATFTIHLYFYSSREKKHPNWPCANSAGV